MYYYFKNNSDKIVEKEISYSSLGIFPQFTELTEEQETFYLDNKTETVIPTVIEVKNLTMNVVNAVTLEQYKANVLSILSDKSLQRSEELIPSYQITNCVLSIQAITNSETPIYTNTQIDTIMSEANRIGGLCRTEYYRLKALIQAATNIEEVSNIEDNFSTII